MSEIKIRCEICSELFAIADTDTLRRPMRGHMFKTIDAWHGVPDPFEPSLDWEAMRCPFGRQHRPFTAEDSVLDEHYGRWAVEYPEPPKPLEGINLDDMREVMEDLGKRSPFMPPKPIFELDERFIKLAPVNDPEGTASHEANRPEEDGPLSAAYPEEQQGQAFPCKEEGQAKTEDTGIVCKVCGRTFREKRFLGAHMRAHQ